MKTLQPQLLDEIVERLIRHLQPSTIYLYGSHAYGEPHTDSDIDLYVVVPESTAPPHRRASSVYVALYGLGVPAEVKVATKEEFERRGSWLNSVERTIQERGKVLYAATG